MPDLKILESVVRLYAISMMNLLFVSQRTIELTSHHKPMLQHSPIRVAHPGQRIIGCQPQSYVPLRVNRPIFPSPPAPPSSRLAAVTGKHCTNSRRRYSD